MGATYALSRSSEGRKAAVMECVAGGGHLGGHVLQEKRNALALCEAASRGARSSNRSWLETA